MPLPPQTPLTGSFAEQQAFAKRELGEQLSQAEGESSPHLARVYIATQSAVAQAVSIVMMSRSTKPLDPAGFIGSFVRVEAATDSLKSWSEVPKLLADFWPKDPGFTIAVYAGWSAMEAGWKFADGIRNACVVGRALHCVPSSGMPYATEQATRNACGPHIVAWAEMAMKELRERTLPVEQVWPNIVTIRRDMVGYDFKLRDEYDRATRAAAPTPKP